MAETNHTSGTHPNIQRNTSPLTNDFRENTEIPTIDEFSSMNAFLSTTSPSPPPPSTNSHYNTNGHSPPEPSPSLSPSPWHSASSRPSAPSTYLPLSLCLNPPICCQQNLQQNVKPIPTTQPGNMNLWPSTDLPATFKITHWHTNQFPGFARTGFYEWCTGVAGGVDELAGEVGDDYKEAGNGDGNKSRNGVDIEEGGNLNEVEDSNANGENGNANKHEEEKETPKIHITYNLFRRFILDTNAAYLLFRSPSLHLNNTSAGATPFPSPSPSSNSSSDNKNENENENNDENENDNNEEIARSERSPNSSFTANNTANNTANSANIRANTVIPPFKLAKIYVIWTPEVPSQNGIENHFVEVVKTDLTDCGDAFLHYVFRVMKGRGWVDQFLACWDPVFGGDGVGGGFGGGEIGERDEVEDSEDEGIDEVGYGPWEDEEGGDRWRLWCE